MRAELTASMALKAQANLMILLSMETLVGYRASVWQDVTALQVTQGLQHGCISVPKHKDNSV